MNDVILRGISKSFGEKHVLDGVTLTFPGGEITCLMGPSGRGKTTVLNIIAGLVKPDGGAAENVPARIGFVFQEDRLLEERSALSNVRFAVGNRASAEEIMSALKELEIDSAESPVGEFSGGMKRRVAIARAVLYGGDVLLLDEPFRGLDGKLRKKTADFIIHRAAGKTVICVTHDMEEAELLNARVIELR